MSLAVADLAPPRARGSPAGWTEVVLRDLVVDIVSGEWGAAEVTADEAAERVRVAVLRSAEFRDWERERGAGAPVRVVARASLARRRLASGDLVLEVSGGSAGRPVGRTVLIDDETVDRARHPLVCSNFCRRLRLHPAVEPAFVQLALTHKYLAGELDDLQTHTTNLRNLAVGRLLSEVVLPLPPRAEQRRIAVAVAALRAPLARARAALARSESALACLDQAIYAAAYSGRLTATLRCVLPREDVAGALEQVFRRRHRDYARARWDAEAQGRRTPRRPRNLEPSAAVVPAPLPRPVCPPAWPLVALQDVIVRAQHGTSARAETGANGRGVPVLRMGNIQGGRIDLADLKRVTLPAHELEVFSLAPGDILFNRTNSPELVGKAAVYDRETAAVFASYLIRIAADPRLVLSRYLCGWINSPWGRAWARAVRSDCVSQSNISAAKLLTLPVPLPPLSEQAEIVAAVDVLRAQAAAARERLDAARGQVRALEQSILDLALRGELAVPEAVAARREKRRFETADELLDRVRVDRLAAASVNTVLAAVRQTCWGAGRLSRDELLRRTAFRLGGPRSSRGAGRELERYLELALERGIVACENGLYFGAAPNFGRYDFDFLIRAALWVLADGAECGRLEVTEEVASHLGFSQVTAAIQERMERVYQWGAQTGVFVLGARTVRSARPLG